MTGAGTYNSDELVPHPNRRLRTLTDYGGHGARVDNTGFVGIVGGILLSLSTP